MIKTLILTLMLPIFCNAQSTNNLDIKNGFLQFKLGDSISNYKEIIDKSTKTTPTRYEVKAKAFNKLRRYLEAITLVTEKGVITEIDVSIQGDYNENYIDDAIKKVYGSGAIVENDDELYEGTHISSRIWEGKRVALVAKKTRIVVVSSNVRVEIKNETIQLKKTSDLKMDGQLNADFPL